MAKVFNWRQPFADSAWKISFADSLIGMCPDMNPDAADEAADEEFGRSTGIEPRVAALSWASGHGYEVRPAAAGVDPQQSQSTGVVIAKGNGS